MPKPKKLGKKGRNMSKKSCLPLEDEILSIANAFLSALRETGVGGDLAQYSLGVAWLKTCKDLGMTCDEFSDILKSLDHKYRKNHED